MQHRGGAQGYLGLRWYLNVPRAKGGYVLVNFCLQRAVISQKVTRIGNSTLILPYCGGIQQLPLKPVL